MPLGSLESPQRIGSVWKVPSRGLLLGLLVAACWPLAAGAQDVPVVVEGQPFAPRASLAGSEVLLNGTGVRAAGWFKGYAAGLYLLERTGSADRARALPPPKRLQLRLLLDVPAVELSKAVRKGITRNSSDADRLALEPQLARFEAQINAVGKVRKGDVVDLDQGVDGALRLSVNGTLRGATQPGAALYAALLQSFVGARPYDERLKAGLLGRTR
jgi:hypothetical protein